jgi:hypothetical protein
MGRLEEWIAWGYRQLTDDAPSPSFLTHTTATSYWEDGYWLVYDLIIDNFSDDEADYLLENIKPHDIAVAAAALMLSRTQDDWLDVVTARLLRRYDWLLAERTRMRHTEAPRVSIHVSYSDADPL